MTKEDVLEPDTVELVGGPLCGATIKWPTSMLEGKAASLKYMDKLVVYVYEGNGKAVWKPMSV